MSLIYRLKQSQPNFTHGIQDYLGEIGPFARRIKNRLASGRLPTSFSPVRRRARTVRRLLEKSLTSPSVTATIVILSNLRAC